MTKIDVHFTDEAKRAFVANCPSHFIQRMKREGIALSVEQQAGDVYRITVSPLYPLTLQETVDYVQSWYPYDLDYGG